MRFHEPLDPRPVEVGDTQVLCHLHDEEALEAARHAKAEGSFGRGSATSRHVPR